MMGGGGSGDWPPSPLWDYAVGLYGRPGVAAACLALQDRRGADVNLLLLACWLAAAGRRPDASRLARARAEAADWQEAIVRPLRNARLNLKRAIAEEADGAIRAPLEAARARLAGMELDAERAELLLLERACGGGPSHAGDARPATLAGALLRHFAAFGPGDATEIRILLRGAFPDEDKEWIGRATLDAMGLGRPDRDSPPGAPEPFS